MTATLTDLGISVLRVAFVMGFVLNLGGLMTWVERKQSAVMQDRVGANRASILGFRLLGLFHPLADAVKMLVKEDFIVLPYTNDDLIAARKLIDAGAAAVMPLAAPIGSGLGIQNPANLRILRS